MSGASAAPAAPTDQQVAVWIEQWAIAKERSKQRQKPPLKFQRRSVDTRPTE